jgi:hypothetical protein
MLTTEELVVINSCVIAWNEGKPLLPVVGNKGVLPLTREGPLGDLPALAFAVQQRLPDIRLAVFENRVEFVREGEERAKEVADNLCPATGDSEELTLLAQLSSILERETEPSLDEVEAFEKAVVAYVAKHPKPITEQDLDNASIN